MNLKTRWLSLYRIRSVRTRIGADSYATLVFDWDTGVYLLQKTHLQAGRHSRNTERTLYKERGNRQTNRRVMSRKIIFNFAQTLFVTHLSNWFKMCLLG